MSGDNAVESDVLLIDGNTLEGGGQILRLAMAFSVLMTKPIKVYNIRGGRAQGGLRPQHLKGIELACEMCGGKLIGAAIGSAEIKFYPGVVRSRKYAADTKTAGSVGLLAQVALPIALFGQDLTTLSLKGGTNADMAPPVDYTEHVFLPMLKKFGGECNYSLIKRGFYPKGGGEVLFRINSVPNQLNAVQMVEFGNLRRITGLSYVAGVLPIEMAREMADVAKSILKPTIPADVEIDIRVVKESYEKAVGNGSGIILYAETSTDCILGASFLGGPKYKAKEVGEKAANELVRYIQQKVCVDDNMQDQIVCLMALANGKSAVKCGEITKHTKTAIFVVELMTEAKFSIIREDSTSILECTGIGLRNTRYNPR